MKVVDIIIGEKNHCVIGDGVVLAHLKTWFLKIQYNLPLIYS